MTERLAVIGSGIAGMGCAHFLHPHYELSLFEKNDTVGGHTNTVAVPQPDGSVIQVDTGFMVFNTITYPHLVQLFEALDVACVPTDMSFSVHHGPTGLEWNGAGWNRLFGQRKNMVNPRFWAMLLDLDRFNKAAEADLETGMADALTIEAYAKAKGYGDDLLQWFLLPMSAAIWSTDPNTMRGFPARTLLRFFHNHGFLGLKGHYQWYTVKNGSRRYIEKLLPPLGNRVFCSQGVQSVLPDETGVTLEFLDGTSQRFDRVILAAHADQALRMLASPTPLESELLSQFPYEKNTAMLHSDTTVMPHEKRCWASWNYSLRQDASGEYRPATHYWMNNLQHISMETPLFVSINAESFVNPGMVIETILYEHPIFTLAGIDAQHRLPQLNTQQANQRVFFCGSYFRYGFHEDAFGSAVSLCQQLLGVDNIWKR